MTLSLAAFLESPMGALGADVCVPWPLGGGTISTHPTEKITHKVVASEKNMAVRVVLPRTLDRQPGNMSSSGLRVPRDIEAPAISSALVASREKRRCQRRRKEHP